MHNIIRLIFFLSIHSLAQADSGEPTRAEVMAIVKQHTIEIDGSETPELLPYGITVDALWDEMQPMSVVLDGDGTSGPVVMVVPTQDAADFDNTLARNVMLKMCIEYGNQLQQNAVDVHQLAAYFDRAHKTEIRERGKFYKRQMGFSDMTDAEKADFDVQRIQAVEGLSYSYINKESLSYDLPDRVLKSIQRVCNKGRRMIRAAD